MLLNRNPKISNIFSINSKNELFELQIISENELKNYYYNNKKILEIGCGIGTDAVMFAKEKCEYYGIDLSDESLEITKQRFKIYNLDGKFYNINLL